MNRLFVLVYIHIKEIRPSYKMVIGILFFALVASNEQARNTGPQGIPFMGM